MPAAAAIASVAGGLIAAKGAKDAAKAGAQGSTTKQELDPRAARYIYGEGEDTGLLGRFSGMLDTPQNRQLMDYEQANLNMLSTAPDDLRTIRNTANQLVTGQAAPQAQATVLGGPNAYAVGNMVQAPSQNKTDLSKAYQDFIYGERGANPYLTGAIGKGINQARNAFQDLQDDSTRNLTENVMPGIRSNSVLAGQYGGSRQGIAEGRALGDFGREQQRAISRFGQGATDAAVAAQAGAYETDANRALSATQGLGAQQYGVAQQDAATRNAAEFMNVGQVNQNQAATAAMGQQTNLANLGAQQAANELNQRGQVLGTGLLSGGLASQYGVGQNQDAYALNRAGQVSGLMAPYLGMGGSSTNTQPLYSNTGAGLLGGAAAGLGLYNELNKANTPQPTPQQPYMNFNVQPGTQPINSGALQNMNWWNG